jgi:two-component system, sensor histidine kinase
MTANAMPEDRRRCEEAGMDDYVSKPISIIHLQNAIEAASSRMTIGVEISASSG